MIIDEREFEHIYEKFAQKIYVFCYFRVNSKEEAEDLAASVFVRAWDYIVSDGKVTNIQAFLYRIASNLIIDYYRKNRGQREISIDNPKNVIEITDDADIQQKTDQGIRVKKIRNLLSQLPDTYREVIILRYLDDMSVKEISRVLKSSENNISVRLHRAIEKIQSLISKTNLDE